MFIGYIYFFILLLYGYEARVKEINCPEYCNCDIFETLRRATCQNKKLTSIEIDVPPQAEILELSYNQISELGSNVFLEIGLSNLVLLNLSHNIISQIHLYGFEGLAKLKTLDLSFNRIRYFNKQWFVSLNSLEELYLKGNSLRSLNDEAHLQLKHLRVLDISYCSLTSLRPDVFEGIPNLQQLDISGNFLIQVRSDVIKPLTNLNVLLVEDNLFNCKDNEFVLLKNYTTNNGISYKDPCRKDKNINKKEKFQKIISLVTQVPKNSWIYDDEEEDKSTKIIEVCNDGFVNNTKHNFIDIALMEVIQLSPALSVLFIFTFGIFLGLIIGCCVELRIHGPKQNFDNTEDVVDHTDGSLEYPDGSLNYRPYNVDNRIYHRQESALSNFSSRSRTRSFTSRKLPKEDRNSLLLNEYHLSDSTPVIARKVYI